MCSYLTLSLNILKYIAKQWDKKLMKMIDDITCVFEGVAGIGGIFISNLRAAQNLQLLNKYGIKAIVTAVRGGVVQHDKSSISDHLYVPADDIESYDLSKHFQQTYAFIDSARKKTNVLVHCYAGISRSATIVIAYLLKKYNYSLQKVISMVKRRRTIINPNKGFIDQLKKQAAKMGIVSNQNEQPLQQVLKKRNPSVQKKRSVSTYVIKRPSNQSSNSQKEGRVSLASNINPQRSKQIKQQIIPVTLVQRRTSQMVLPDESQNIKKYRSNMINEKIQKASNDILKLKLLDDQKFYSFTPKTARQNTNNRQPQQVKLQFDEKNYNSVLSDKFQKIQRLKNKVFQSEKRKKQALTSRRHQSQLKQKVNEVVKYSINPQPGTSTKLSIQLNSTKGEKQKASTKGSSYQTILSQNSIYSRRS